ncbi:MAG: carbohydrate kinase family protein [Patescibacteria group bacterium]
MYDLISIGDCMIDAFHILEDHEINIICNLDKQQCRLCLTYADKIPVREIHKLVAGNAANNAVGASRLGLKTAIYTVVGDDLSGEMIKAKLEAEGLAMDYFVKERGAESNYSTVLSYQGERTILVYHSVRSFRWPIMAKAGWVYLTSLPESGQVALTADLLTYLENHRAKLIYQPGTFQLRLGAEKTSEILKQTDVLIMNKEEAEDYLHREGEPQALLAGLQQLGSKIAVVTDGTKGSYAADQTSQWFLGTRPEIARAEATGAGDAYASGFTAALMIGLPVPEAMRWGTFNAEGVIGQIGPQAGLLTREAMEHQSSKNPDFQAKLL